MQASSIEPFKRLTSHLDSTNVVANVQVLNIPIVTSKHFGPGP